MQIQKTEKIPRNANLSINNESLLLLLFYHRFWSSYTFGNIPKRPKIDQDQDPGIGIGIIFLSLELFFYEEEISSDEITVGVIIISQHQYIDPLTTILHLGYTLYP